MPTDPLYEVFQHEEREREIAAQKAAKCCDLCHEPVDDGCACQDEYTREHDCYAER